MKPFMMILAFLAAIIALPVSAEDENMPSKMILEVEAKAVSEFLYTELIRQAFNKGWRFTPEQMESGYRRHFEEFKLQLINQGYTIVTGEVGV